MHTVFTTPAVAVSRRPVADVSSDLLVVPLFEDDEPAAYAALDAAAGGEIGLARARGELTGKPFEVLTVATAAAGWRTPRAVVVGAGRRAHASADRLRRIATVGGLTARQRRLTRLAILHPGGTGIPPETAVQALTEGVCLANYDGASYKSSEPPRVWLDSVELCVDGDPAALEDAIARGRILGEYTNRARALANAPGNELTPRAFAARALAIAAEAGLQAEELDEARIAALGMRLLLGVSQGSDQPPRVVVLRHDPPGALPGVVLGLVGKGITFDTGGISIKPAENMDKMKDDMTGGAAVICAMAAIARLNAPVRCLGVVPMAENMPGGRAMRPGDVITSAAGKTVEILNTDAEGRLALGDAVWYARELGATHLVDIATLTGACVVALGKTTSGLFGTPPAWVEQVRRASERAGDRSWPMPVFDDYKELFKSEIADFTNTGGRAAGAITGALFVKEFAGDLPWVHMDIAGTAWAEEARPYQPKGATGVGVRTLAELALDAASWSKLELKEP